MDTVIVTVTDRTRGFRCDPELPTGPPDMMDLHPARAQIEGGI